MATEKPDTLTKAQRIALAIKKRWQDPEYRKMMISKQKAIGLRSYQQNEN